jgi:2-C-methyl-D-erythritol 2,4-cyclodiphosphate synthase
LKIRVGFGYDIHPLEDGKRLFLGGMEIPFSKGLAGHSDGDCLIHSIIDALLGAMGEKDIGQQFPDTDDEYLNIRSAILLKKVAIMLNDRGAEVLNIDSVIVAEQPKLNTFIPEMKKNLCNILNIDRTSLGIKAKTNEGLDAIGRGKAIAAYVTVLIKMEEE